MAKWKADDGSLIHFEIQGVRNANRNAARTMLLIPGLLGSAERQWRQLAPALGNERRLVFMDLRGHGRSENRAPGLAPEQMARDLAGLLEYLEADRVDLAGYDLGGYLALLTYLKAPSRVARIFMHATKYYYRETDGQAMRAQLDPDRLSEAAPAFANKLAVEHGAARWRSLARQAADLTAHLQQHGLKENALAQIRCPVLVSVGDRDEIISVKEAYRLAHALPKAALLVMPDVGHPFQTIDVKLLIAALDKFFNE